MPQRALRNISLTFLLAAALGGCGGSGSSASGTGQLTLGVTDAPVDHAVSVNVVFTGVTLKPADGSPVDFTFDSPRSIDLLNLTGDSSELLLDGVTVPAGRYDWVRLDVDAGTPNHPDSGSSTIVIDSTQGPENLLIPSGSRSGLKLVRGFTVPADGSASFTIDFDLRKSVVLANGPANGKYMLKPTLRLVENNDAGHLAFTATASYLAATCISGTSSYTVYVFSGADATLDDIDGIAPEPVTTVALHDPDADGNYTGTAGFLPAGTYTAAFTCDGASDDPQQDDPNIGLVDAASMSVQSGGTTSYTFQ